jgi:hypothetical protein
MRCARVASGITGEKKLIKSTRFNKHIALISARSGLLSLYVDLAFTR